ncbi:ribosome biogenesis GTPase Der [Thiothrix subterranea]|uniref:GTPase Der n=1 Tax=Thiothrix subterranea TaxID=2735563 RepID=A0AA51MQT7_9GAMM|nr:ribosome biogenesis GTPase Der [Thiothrix subterranea]MDQ5767454.1 ribosome biogenesis GTPase Der [Thiothrix subterranea]WML88675.1 ribosome biogenesis GTPase Der [Thiothrix subterranea]
MKPVLALIGRPNVGKSTLFNRLTRSRDALVADFPGLTRDRKYGTGELNGRSYMLIDTGGLSGEEVGIDEHMAKQTRAAMQEADAILFIVDGKQGLTAADQQIAQDIRVMGKPVYLLVNKIDGVDADQASSEFYSLGFTEVFQIAAVQGRGVTVLMTAVLDSLGADFDVEEEEEDDGSIRIAFVGRPNVGKSTLINRIMGEERVIAFDQPGTTRDSIFIPFERDGQAYTLIDTAGVRRRSRVDETIEKFSIIKTLDAIQRCHVVIMLVDAHDSITDQDAHLLGLILDAGKALVLAVNKWDGMESDDREWIKQQLEVKLPFLDFAEKYFISALHGSNVGLLYTAVKRAYDSAMLKVPTPRLTRILEMAVQQHQPPLTRGQRIKLRYAHQGGSNPFRVIIHGNRTDYVPDMYTRYLTNYFHKTLKLVGSQVRIEYKGGENPYEGKRNTLTPRQEHTQKRLAARIHKIKKSEKKKK